MGTTEDDEWITIRRFDDPVEADITMQFLRDHGVPVAVLGNSGATGVLNRFTTVLDIRLTVPSERLDDAREALEALANATPEQPFRGKAPPPETEAPLRTKSKAAGFILAFLVPFGGGHFYAQHTAGAIVLASGIAGGWLGALVGGRPELYTAAGLLVAIDAFAAPLAVTRLASGNVPSDGAQRRAALGAVALAFAAALLMR